jgi:hypothetical protein
MSLYKIFKRLLILLTCQHHNTIGKIMPDRTMIHFCDCCGQITEYTVLKPHSTMEVGRLQTFICVNNPAFAKYDSKTGTTIKL